MKSDVRQWMPWVSVAVDALLINIRVPDCLLGALRSAVAPVG